MASECIEIGQSGNIYATEISKSHTPALFLPLENGW